MSRRAVFPGSFDPLTIGHLAVADAVVDQLGATSVDLVISEVALAKERTVQAPPALRLAAIEAARERGRPWLSGRTTGAQLLADIAEGYDVVVMGADKWHELLDPAFYGASVAARDAAVARLPFVAVAPRAGTSLPEDPTVHVLDVPADVRHVSATEVRRGRHDWRA